MPTKLLILIVATLLIISIGFTFMSLSRLQQEFRQFKAETLHQGQVQFEQHSDVVQTQIRVWLESFSDLTYLKKQGDFNLLAKELEQQFDSLQLHYNVEGMWLLDPDMEPLFASQELPQYLMPSVQIVLSNHEPISQLYCRQSCEQLVVAPLLNKSGQVAVVAVAVSLVDVLYAIHSSLNSEIAVVSYKLEPNTKLQAVNVISSTNKTLFNEIFLSNETELYQVRDKGLQVQHSDVNYLVNLMPLAAGKNREFYLAFIDDVSSFVDENEHYRNQFLFSAFFIFISLLLAFDFIARPITGRLMVLSSALPLLAQRKFDQFREVKIDRNELLYDELDVLAQSTRELSFELEELDLEIEQKTKELENIAMYDVLTGLPNRNMLNFHLKNVVSNIDDDSGGVAVLFLDLDDFKKVNDSHGHNQGDALLIEAANRVRIGAREYDLACRFGGDEFVLVLTKIHSEQEVIKTAIDVLRQFKTPIKIGTSLFYVSVSIGIAFTNDNKAKADELVSFADIAMYEAKANGGAQFYIHHDAMSQKITRRVMLEGEVRQALAKNQFTLSLQPQLLSANNKLFGFEALLRWHHPERGMVPPDDFIPILENSEHMIELGYWIIRHCFEIMVDLHEHGFKDIRIAINLTAAQFIDPMLPDYLKSLLHEFSLSASCFELELTEQTLVKDVNSTIEVMEELKAIGFSFAIDDFGTGYSSLAYLKQMPVDVIKIDKSFIFGMMDNEADYQIIMSVIAMVKKLGLLVIAEGVETSAQLRSLTLNDCDVIQGYYFSKPIPEDELFDFIARHTNDGYWKTGVKCVG